MWVERKLLQYRRKGTRRRTAFYDLKWILSKCASLYQVSGISSWLFPWHRGRYCYSHLKDEQIDIQRLRNSSSRRCHVEQVAGWGLGARSSWLQSGLRTSPSTRFRGCTFRFHQPVSLFCPGWWAPWHRAGMDGSPAEPWCWERWQVQRAGLGALAKLKRGWLVFLKVYLLVTVLAQHCCTWAFSSCDKRELLSSCRASHWGDFSCEAHGLQ